MCDTPLFPNVHDHDPSSPSLSYRQAMVLTRRASKSISRWLPNEVLSQIMEAVSSSDLAALCRTCKLFHAIATPFLYRVVYLRSEDVENFCSTVLGDIPKFAELVRSFTTDARPCQPLIGPLVSKCVKTLTRIENISINGHYLQNARLDVMACTFPHLSRCILSLKDNFCPSTKEEDMVASFLIRHPALKSVIITHSWSSEFWPSTLACIPLLDLQRICASPRRIPSILARNLHEVRLEWIDRDPVEPVFSILGPMTGTENPFVYSHFCWGDQFAEIMDSISRHVPHAKTIHMDVYALESWVREEIIVQVIESLPLFTGLRSFGIQSKGNSAGATSTMWGENDGITVRGLGDICSTLQMCRLNKNAWRKINGTWELFPIEDFRTLAGITFSS
ncbi:hypothetical protein C8R47DRAFT_604321 [Mycena vitilis]|nr:hypothetical protein C8R47DRAFT_604321 [Mycena vitilis]